MLCKFFSERGWISCRHRFHYLYVLWIHNLLSLIYVYCVHSSEFVCGDTSPESPHGTPFLVILYYIKGASFCYAFSVYCDLSQIGSHI